MSLGVSSSGDETMYQVLYTVALVTELVLGVIVILDIEKRKMEQRALKYLFYGCIGVAWTTSITFVVGSFLPQQQREANTFVLICVIWAVSLLNFLFLYLTLVWRIHYTFSLTSYRPSKWWTLKCYIVSFLLVVLPLPRLHLNLRFNDYDEIRSWKYYTLCIICLSSWTMTYFIASVAAVYQFHSKLMAVVKTQQGTSGMKMKKDVGTKDDALNSRQQKFVQLATRYIYLFIFASCSSIMLWSSVNSSFATDYEVLYPFFIFLDHIVNAGCLYLQFGFTSHLYQKLCGYPDKCCMRICSRQIRRWQKRNGTGSNEMSPPRTHVADSSMTDVPDVESAEPQTNSRKTEI